MDKLVTQAAWAKECKLYKHYEKLNNKLNEKFSTFVRKQTEAKRASHSKNIGTAQQSIKNTKNTTEQGHRHVKLKKLGKGLFTKF